MRSLKPSSFAFIAFALLSSAAFSFGASPLIPPAPRRVAPVYAWAKTDKALTLLNGAKVVWRLNYNPAEGKPYFHPLGLANGTPLTWLRPPDHPWHRGVWFSWKYLNGLNYWEEDPKTGRAEGETELIKVEVDERPDFSARVTMTLSYHPPKKPAVLTEKRELTITPPDARGDYRIAWRSVFTAGKKDVLLDRTPIPGEEKGVAWGGYAGLSFRIAKDTRSLTVMDSEGRRHVSVHGKNARWVDIIARMPNGSVGGVTIFDHPGNFRHPAPWYIATTKPMQYFSPAPLFNESYTLKANKILTLRYGLFVHAGQLMPDRLEAEWKTLTKNQP